MKEEIEVKFKIDACKKCPNILKTSPVSKDAKPNRFTERFNSDLHHCKIDNHEIFDIEVISLLCSFREKIVYKKEKK